MPVRNQRGVAKWVKILLWTIVVILILSLATCTIGGYLLFNSVKEMADPKKAAAVAASMVTLPDPLPEKYKWQVGLDAFETPVPVKVVCLKDKEATMEYYIILLKNSGDKDLTPEQFAREIAEKKNIPQGVGGDAVKGFSVKEQATMTVAGKEMPCAIGVTDGVHSDQRPALIGCLMPDKTRVLLLCAYGPEGTAELNKKAVSEFFGMIKEVR